MTQGKKSFMDEMFGSQKKPTVVDAEFSVQPSVNQGQTVQQPVQPNVQQPVQPNVQQPVQPVVQPVVQQTQQLMAPQVVQPVVQQNPPLTNIVPPQEEQSTPIPPASCHAGKWGDKMSRSPVERFKGVEGIVDRIAIVTQDIVITKTHYMKDRGYIYCFSGECCDTEGLPSLRYVVPIIKYDSDRTGKPQSAKFQFMYMSLGQDAYDALYVLNQNVPLDTIDMLVTCSDEQYQKLTFNNIGPTLWKNPQMGIAEQVAQEFQNLWKKVPSCIARPITREKYLMQQQPSYQPQTPQQSQQFDMSKFMRK